MKSIGMVISGACVAGTCLFFSSCHSSSPHSVEAKSDTVIISQMKFIPAVITVNKGDTVVFINQDMVTHDVTEVNKAWASPPLSMGDSWRLVPTQTAGYYCSIHLVMKGKIIVE